MTASSHGGAGVALLGFLYPGTSACDDLAELTARLAPPARAEIAQTPVAEDAHQVDALQQVGSVESLTAGARLLQGKPLASVIWACTSGSFVRGLDGARLQARQVERFLGVPASSTSLAYLEALMVMGIDRVAIAGSYPDPVVESFRDFLGQADITVVSAVGEQIFTAAEVGTLAPARVSQLALRGDHPDAQAVLVPDTAMHTGALLETLEQDLGKPVLTANQVTVWQAQALAGRYQPQPGLGSLFRTSLPTAGPQSS